MARKDGFVRLVNKFLPQGATPSVPTSDDHTDGTWTYTDIYDREITINDQGQFFYRAVDTIYELTSGTGGSGTPGTQSLAQTLTYGNIMEGQFISSDDGQTLFGIPTEGVRITSEDPGLLLTDVRFDKNDGVFMGHDDMVTGNGGAFYVTKNNIQTNSYLPTGGSSTQNIQAIHINQGVNSGSASVGSSTFDIYYNETKTKTDVVNDGGYNTLSAGQRTYQDGAGAIGSEITTSNTSQGFYANIYNWFDPATAAVENIFSITAANPYGASYITNITQRKDEIKVQGNVGTFRGIEYVDDYSADFTGNSLVTKDWVLSNSSQSLTDTVCNRTDEIFVDASGGEYECNPYIYPTTSYTTIRSAMSGATAAIYVDPNVIKLNVVEIPGSYESEITITDEILTMYGGRGDVDNQTTWGIELGTEVRRYRYKDPTTPWGTPDKFEEKRFVIHKKFTSDTGVPGQMDLYYENFEQEAINDFEIDFYIMNNETYGPQRKYMTKSYKRRVHYDNYNSATILIPDETKEGDTLNHAYESWSITTQSSIYGTKYVLDWNLDGSYDYSVTIVVKQSAKKY